MELALSRPHDKHKSKKSPAASHAAASHSAASHPAVSHGSVAGVIAAAPATFSLGFHSDFACASSGVCCHFWKIAVEAEPYRRLCEGLAAGRILMPEGRSPDPAQCFESPSPTPTSPRHLKMNGPLGCPFLEPGERGLCAAQRQAGPESLSWACRLFPRLCVIQPGGVWITLSHFCPTVAHLLFRTDQAGGTALAVLRNPPAFPAGAPYGGHDARTHQPPLLAPGVLMSWASYELWERHAVSFMALPDYTPEAALIVLVTTVEKVRAARPDQATRPEYFSGIFLRELDADAAALQAQLAGLPSGAERCRQLYQILLDGMSDTVPEFDPLREAFRARYHDAAGSDSRPRFRVDYQHFVRQAWPGFATPLRRYLAAKLFANRFACQGDGLRTGLFAAVCALAALRVHATLACAREGRELDAPLFLEAVRMTDYLIHHGSDAARLARLFSQIEPLPIMELIAPVPV